MPVPYMTNVTLYSGVPWDNTYTDVRYFDGGNVSIPGQVLYNSGATYTYQRVNSSVEGGRPSYTLRVNRPAGELYNCNYMSFNNNDVQGGKTFYCFVNKVNYVAPDTTELVYEIDEFTTWFYDCTVRPSFVVREHVAEDGDYGNGILENIQLNKISQPEQSLNTWFFDTLTLTMGTSAGSNDTDLTPTGVIKNVYLPLKYYTSTDSSIIDYNLGQYADAGVLDRVVHIYAYMSNNGDLPSLETHSIGTPTNIDGYTPRNKKLFSKEFNSFRLHSSNGDSVALFYENLAPYYQIQITTGNPPAYQAMAIPYYGTGLNYNYALVADLSYLCPWVGDTYSSYMGAQRQQMLLTNLLNVITTTVGGAASGAAASAFNPAGIIAGAGAGLISGIAGGIANIAAYDFAGELVSGDYHGGTSPGMAFATSRVGFYGNQECIEYSQAEALDQYFDLYGYRTNQVKTPNLTGRQYFNFVQTRNVCITGSIPASSMANIKQMFNNGIRLWHNNNVGQYDPATGNPIG